MFHYTSCGLPNVWLKNGFSVKKFPDGDAVSIHNLEGLHKVIGLNLVCNKKNLTATEVRFLRKELDMSQTTLATVFGVGETTIRNWENRRAKITGPAERILRLLYKEHVDGDGTVRGLVDRIADLNRHNHQAQYKFEETEDGWKQAA